MDSLPKKSYGSGEIIASIGDSRRSIFGVATGAVTARTTSGVVLVRRGAGEIFGEYPWSLIVHCPAADLSNLR